MKALIWDKDKTIKVVDKAKPKIINGKDAIVKVTYSSICTSDLHIIEGYVPKAIPRTTLGHEYVGIIEEVGSEIKNFKKGDRVIANCETICGECYFCKRGYVNNCENGGWLIGCSLDGSQAEYVRVLLADTSLTKIPDNVSDKSALFVGDIFATGYWGAEIAEIEKDDIVAVIGSGPVGLLTMQSLRYLQAKKIIALDVNDYRLKIAKEQNLADYFINPKKQNVEEEILKLTNNRGADKVIECAGSDSTFELAWKIARKSGIVVICAMYSKSQELPLPLMYGKNLTFKTGGVHASCCDKLANLISQNKLNSDFLITQEFDFKDIIKAYDFFKNNKDSCLKVAIKY